MRREIPLSNVKYTVDEWSRRIKALLSWHFVQIVDVQGLWMVQVPDQGLVRGFFGAADGQFVVETCETSSGCCGRTSSERQGPYCRSLHR